MKKIAIIISVICVICGSYSCSDMLEADSSRQLFDPQLDQKTDSVFYAYGIMQAVQQLADQYYFQNEMRGELVKPTARATTHLRELASFSANATNKYDSVYLYYKVINNCNYYLAHRDTTLQTGGRNVVCNEYAAVASFRAWTYLQLARQYGSVPYITEPVTTISQINANTSMTGYETILAGEAEMLEGLKRRYTNDQISVPTFGITSRDIGRLNWSGNVKTINPAKCFIPLNIVLGDIYLELCEYEKAAKCYYDYLYYTAQRGISNVSTAYVEKMSPNYSNWSPIFKNFTEWPIDYNTGDVNGSTLYALTNDWEDSFKHSNNPGDVISYIPMAVNYTNGQTTDIPAAFGYDYYAQSRNSAISTGITFADFNCPKTENIQVVPSETYCDSARLAQYYYYSTEEISDPTTRLVIKSAKLGDARAEIVAQGREDYDSYVWVHKPSTAYVPLYRNATVWLHLAEAINRMGYPDAAFAVLKNGLHAGLESYRYKEVYKTNADGEFVLDGDGNKILDEVLSQTDKNKHYLTPESYELLTTTLPFLAQQNEYLFRNGTTRAFVGIHFHGAGVVEDINSPYRYSTVLEAKLNDLNTKFGLGLTTYTKDDYINAMEDLLCDEYAMEFAFEGTRFSDLRRLAIHKNRAGLYGGNFGDRWLSKKLENNAAGITTQNCYLPYK